MTSTNAGPSRRPRSPPISDGFPSAVPSDITFTPIQAAPFANYVEDLEVLHSKYSTLDEQLCPPSRTPSPVPEPRNDVLRTGLKDAIKYAGFNPMSSRWNKVHSALRITSTSRRYCGVADGIRLGEKVEVEVGRYKFVLPDTDEEWKQCEEKWERRFEKSPTPQTRTSKFFPAGNEQPKPSSKAALVRDKVKAWQANIVPVVPNNSETVAAADAPDPPSSSKGKGKETQSKRQSPLPFSVAKRYATAVTAEKPTESTAVGEKALSDPPPSRRSPGARDHDPPRSPRRIADLSEMEYIPPSFPQQLVTSTPAVPGKGADVPKKSKPPLILPRPNTSSSSSSPLLPNQSLERKPPPLASSSSLQQLDPFSPRAEKRIRPITPPSEASPRATAAKKAKTHAESEALPNAPPRPATPPILTSPPQTPLRPTSSGKGLGNAKGLPVPSTPTRGALPTLTELLASSRRSRPRPRPPSRKARSAATTPAPEDRGNAREGSVRAEELPAVGEEREVSPAPTAASRARTLLSSPASGSSGSPQSVRDRARSPISPLFAKHGDFAPPFASTQAAGGFGDIAASQPPAGGPAGLSRAGSNAVGMGYNSQFDVEGQVGMVSDLLEKDVDFDGWLRDIPEAEAER